MSNMTRFNWIHLTMMAVLVTALPAQAQWKWRDQSGRVQYSDIPPPAGVAEKDILQRPASAMRLAPAAAPAASAASAPGLNPARIEPELEAKRRKAEEEEAAKKKQADSQLAARRAENCAQAKSHLRTIEEGMRLVRTNNKGEREVLDDQARAEEAKRTRAVIASDCK
jgi:hypothetical protein